MTVGTIVGLIDIANNASVDVKPETGVEWVIHNIYVESGKQVKVYRTDGANSVLVDTVTGSLLAFFFHLTSEMYIKLENVSGETINIGYDGMSVR